MSSQETCKIINCLINKNKNLTKEIKYLKNKLNNIDEQCWYLETADGPTGSPNSEPLKVNNNDTVRLFTTIGTLEAKEGSVLVDFTGIADTPIGPNISVSGNITSLGGIIKTSSGNFESLTDNFETLNGNFKKGSNFIIGDGNVTNLAIGATAGQIVTALKGVFPSLFM